MMRHWSKLQEVPFVETRAVIINCATKWVTTLALMSVLRRTSYPALLINCGSTDGSYAHFSKLAESKQLEFDWIEWPLRRHPVALDELFDAVSADRVLLVDSDLEILSAAVPRAMERALDASPHAYGAGFKHGPGWIGGDRGMHQHAGYYVERMWIPLVLLRTNVIRAARKHGLSFSNERHITDIPRFPRLGRALALRYRVRGLQRVKFPIPGSVARDDLDLAEVPAQPRPSFIEFDTGAMLHVAMRRSGRELAEIPKEHWGEVNHYHGITRAAHASSFRRSLTRLKLASAEIETTQDHVIREVKKRLSDVYGVSGLFDSGTR